MNKKIIPVVFLIFFLLDSCSFPVTPIPDISVMETSEIEEIIQETVTLNNCGGLAELTQAASRSSVINVEVGALVEISAKSIQDAIASRYQDTYSNTTSIELNVEPNQHLLFEIQWAIQHHIGIVNIGVDTKQTNYLYSVPLNVEIISVQDVGCGDVTPIPTITPTAQPAKIEILYSESDVQDNGMMVTRSGELFIASVKVGTLLLEYPQEVTIGESTVIRLSLLPANDLDSFPQIQVTPTNTLQSINYAILLNDQLQLYPSMIVDLKGINFDILTDGYQEKPMSSQLPNEWVWNITPKLEGSQSLLVHLSIPVKLRTGQLTQLIENLQLDIDVTKDISSNRIGQQIIDNISTIIVAFIGLVGVLTGVYFTYKSSKKAEENDQDENHPKFERKYKGRS